MEDLSNLLSKTKCWEPRENFALLENAYNEALELFVTDSADDDKYNAIMKSIRRYKHYLHEIKDWSTLGNVGETIHNLISAQHVVQKDLLYYLGLCLYVDRRILSSL